MLIFSLVLISLDLIVITSPADITYVQSDSSALNTAQRAGNLIKFRVSAFLGLVIFSLFRCWVI